MNSETTVDENNGFNISNIKNVNPARQRIETASPHQTRAKDCKKRALDDDSQEGGVDTAAAVAEGDAETGSVQQDHKRSRRREVWYSCA